MVSTTATGRSQCNGAGRKSGSARLPPRTARRTLEGAALLGSICAEGGHESTVGSGRPSGGLLPCSQSGCGPMTLRSLSWCAATRSAGRSPARARKESEDQEKDTALPFGWMGTKSRSRPGVVVYKNIFTGEKISWVPRSPASKTVGESPDVERNRTSARPVDAHKSLPAGGPSPRLRPLNDVVATPDEKKKKKRKKTEISAFRQTFF